jgi:hypothetical protein
MQFIEILRRVKGETVLLNNQHERVVLDIADDFLILQGGNPQMRITEFVPFSQILRLTRADYATGGASITLDIVAGGDEPQIG